MLEFPADIVLMWELLGRVASIGATSDPGTDTQIAARAIAAKAVLHAVMLKRTVFLILRQAS